MLRRTTTPAVSFFGGVSVSVVGFDVTPLCFAEPEIMTSQEGVQRAKVGEGKLRIVQMSIAYVVAELWCGQGTGLRGSIQPKLIDESVENKEEGRRVSIVGILYLKLLRHFAPSFWTEDLFSRYPTVLIHKIEPAFYDVKSGTCQRDTAKSMRVEHTKGQYPNQRLATDENPHPIETL